MILNWRHTVRLDYMPLLKEYMHTASANTGESHPVRRRKTMDRASDAALAKGQLDGLIFDREGANARDCRYTGRQAPQEGGP